MSLNEKDNLNNLTSQAVSLDSLASGQNSEIDSTQSPKKLKRAKKEKNRKKRWWLYPFTFLFNTFLTITLLALVFLGFLTMSNSGLNITIALVNKYLSDYISIEAAEGQLLNEFKLTNIEAKLADDQWLKLEKVELKWNPWALITKEVDVKYLTIANGAIFYVSNPTDDEESTEESEPFKLDDIIIPVTVNVDKISIDTVDMRFNHNIFIRLYEATSNHIFADNSLIKVDERIFANARIYLIEQEIDLPLYAYLQGELNLAEREANVNLNGYSERIVIEKNIFGWALNANLKGDIDDATLILNSRADWDGILTDPIILNVTANLIDQNRIVGSADLRNLDNRMELDIAEWSYLRPLEGKANARFDVKNLSQIHRRLAGILKGNVDVAGNYLQPLIESNLIVQDFVLRDEVSGKYGLAFAVSLGSVAASAPIVELKSLLFEAHHDQQQMIEAKLDLRNLKAGSLTVDSVTLDSDGDMNDHLVSDLIVNNVGIYDNKAKVSETLVKKVHSKIEGSLLNHRFDLLISGPYGNFNINGLARLAELPNNPKWTLYVQDSSINSDFTGTYHLDKPTYFFASKKEISLSTFCLNNLPISFCLEGRYNNVNTVGFVVLRKLPSTILKPFLPDELEIDTSLDIVLNGMFENQEKFVGIADMSLSKGTTSYQLQGRKVDIPLKSTYLRLLARPENIEANLDVDWGDYLRATGKGNILSLFNDPQVTMHTEAHIPTLAWIRPLFPYLQKLEGKLTAKADLSGSLLKPTLGAEVGFNDGNIYIGELNSGLKNIQLNAKLKKGIPELAIKGQTDLGTGRLMLDGKFNIATLTASLKAKGDNLLLADSPNIHAVAITDVKYNLKNNRHTVKGELRLPDVKYLHADFGDDSRGKIKAVSSDLVIISDQEEQKTEAIMDNLALDFRIVIGSREDTISVGMGSFLGKVRGAVTLKKEFNKEIHATGIVNVQSGEYRLYDQLLSLDRGRVQFSGSLMNPLLDIQASREIDMGRSARKAKVGVKISGNLRRPRLELYSNPDMPDLSVVSYLVFGREPNFDSPVENLELVNTMRKILSGQDPGGGSSLASEIGLTDFGLTQDLGGKASVGMGKQVNEKMYVGVGMGLDDSNAYATFRYKFLKYFNFESQVGSEHSSVDVLYTRDF